VWLSGPVQFEAAEDAALVLERAIADHAAIVFENVDGLHAQRFLTTAPAGDPGSVWQFHFPGVAAAADHADDRSVTVAAGGRDRAAIDIGADVARFRCSGSSGERRQTRRDGEHCFGVHLRLLLDAGSSDYRDIEMLMPLSTGPLVMTETEWLPPVTETDIEPWIPPLIARLSLLAEALPVTVPDWL
jgi:hypothetical protein